MIYNNNDENENKNIYDAPENSYSYSSNPEDIEKPRKKRTFLKASAFILSLIIVGAGSVQIYKYTEKNPHVSTIEDDSSQNSENSVNSGDSESSSEESTTKNKNSAVSDTEKLPSLIELASRKDAVPIPDIVENSMPSVVGVSATFEYTSQSIDIWGFGTPSNQTEEIKGTGTGIIMTDDGYIITNAHVVYDTSEYNCGPAVSVSVVLSDETEYEAEVMGCDVETDLAVLKINAKDLKAAEFGDSSDLKVGELVIAIGNPLGFELFGSVTSGIVSAVDRQITVNERKMKLIQTDAAINSGNSGGPLLNSCGQVIGINSAKMSSSYGSGASVEGLGFAIPISEARTIIDDLRNYGYVTGRPQIGIQTQDVSDTISRFYGIPVGVYVVNVSEGSSAEFAGIQKGDVIIGAQGQPVKNLDELNEIKNEYKAGDEITLTISRQGEDEDLEITLVLQEITPEEN